MNQRRSAVQTLPETYAPAWYLDMRERQSLIIANIAGLVLLIASAWGFTRLAYLLHPSAQFQLTIKDLSGLAIILGLVLATIVMVIVHEGLHGLCFWIFTHARPKFAVKQYYAYASAEKWYIPRGQYLLTALAPLIGITALGILLIAFAPEIVILPVLVVLIFNTSGATGDLWVAGALLFHPADTYIHDMGDRVEFYTIRG